MNSAPVTVLRGIRDKRKEAFSSVGVNTVEDLLHYYPLRYEDRSRVVTIAEAKDGEDVTIRARVIKINKHVISRSKNTVTLKLQDRTSRMNIVFFNQHYVADKFSLGGEYSFYGRVTEGQYGKEMCNPSFAPFNGEEMDFESINPIYPLTNDLTQNIVRNAVKESLKICGKPLGGPPDELLKRYGFLDKWTAIENIHFPSDASDCHKSRETLAFIELFETQLMLASLRQDRERRKGISFKFPKEGREQKVLSDFISSLPYKLTDAQQKVWQQISEDMDKPGVMNRLVMGDVGSGKTIIAVLALLKSILCGYQGIFMAPTEILAEQHMRSISAFLSPLGIECVLLTGSLREGQKKDIYKRIGEGSAKCIVGTHALIQEKIVFYNPGIVITDEQHRFGVRQRGMLSLQGERSVFSTTPDVCVMTATPIPRTLALVLYGDLDISVIDSKPIGRMPIKTYWVGESMRQRIYDWILRSVEQGEQVYMVYPTVEEGALEGVKACETQFAELSKGIFSSVPCGLVHGKLPSSDKDKVMRDFLEGRIKILFATTVIEVGVDVPGATLMVIENAERFGLAQLHQLRGRVGRSNRQSFCVLFSDNKSKINQKRMKTMVEEDNGFVISEKDLELRGPGDFFGVAQHGLPEFKMANLYEDSKLLQIAGQAVIHCLSNRNLYEDYLKKIYDRAEGNASL